MKYIVLEVQLNDNGTVGLIPTAFDTEPEALACYHQTLASAAVSSLPCHSAIMINEEGQYLRNDYFRHYAEAPDIPSEDDGGEEE